jgi:hypothetical protein
MHRRITICVVVSLCLVGDGSVTKADKITVPCDLEPVKDLKGTQIAFACAVLEKYDSGNKTSVLSVWARTDSDKQCTIWGSAKYTWRGNRPTHDTNHPLKVIISAHQNEAQVYRSQPHPVDEEPTGVSLTNTGGRCQQ